MPYILPHARARLDSGDSPTTSGELNYAISAAIVKELVMHLGWKGELSYGKMNFIVGALEELKASLYHPEINTNRFINKIHHLCVEYLNNTTEENIVTNTIGALENAKDEFRRRIQHPYEDKKMRKNGDIYTELLSGIATLPMGDD